MKLLKEELKAKYLLFITSYFFFITYLSLLQDRNVSIDLHCDHSYEYPNRYEHSQLL